MWFRAHRQRQGKLISAQASRTRTASPALLRRCAAALTSRPRSAVRPRVLFSALHPVRGSPRHEHVAFPFRVPPPGTAYEIETDEDPRRRRMYDALSWLRSFPNIGRSWSTKLGPPDPECRRRNREYGAATALGIHIVSPFRRWRSPHPCPSAPTQHGGITHEIGFGGGGRTPHVSFGWTRDRLWSQVYPVKSARGRGAPLRLLRHVACVGSAVVCVHRIQMELDVAMSASDLGGLCAGH